MDSVIRQINQLVAIAAEERERCRANELECYQEELEDAECYNIFQFARLMEEKKREIEADGEWWYYNNWMLWIIEGCPNGDVELPADAPKTWRFVGRSTTE